MDEGTGLTLPLAESLIGTALWGSGCWHAPATPWSQSQLWRPFVLNGSMPAPADARSSTLLQLQLLSYADTTPACHPHYTCGLFYGLIGADYAQLLYSVGPAVANEGVRAVYEQELALGKLKLCWIN